MNYSTAVFLINKNVRAVMTIYEAGDNSPRTMFKTMDKSLKVDDFVIVPTNTRHKMTIVKIVDVDVDVDFDMSAQVQWIIGPVDRSLYEKTLSDEGQAVAAIKSAETRKKRDDLRASLLADHVADLKALPIYANGDTKPATPSV